MTSLVVKTSGIMVRALALVGSLLSLSTVSFAAVLYVSNSGSNATGSSWETAFSSLGVALDASATGDEIWVANGTYNEAIQMVSGVALYGGFLGTEAIDEFTLRDPIVNRTSLDATGLEMATVTGMNIDSATLDGFTVTGGNGTLGGGIYLYRSSPTIRRCRVTQNRASYHGAGIYAFTYSSPSILDCEVDHNEKVGPRPGFGGGIASAGQSTPIVDRCFIHHNTSSNYGGGIGFEFSGDSLIKNSTITYNSAQRGGGGVYVSSLGSSSFLAESCIVAFNEAGRGGGISMGGYGAHVSRCQVAGNRAEEGGGGCLMGSGVLENSLIAGNSASIGGGVAVSVDGLVVGCVIHDNRTESAASLQTEREGDFGGGVFMTGMSVLSYSTISRNRSGGPGAGVYVGPVWTPTFRIFGCIVWDNESTFPFFEDPILATEDIVFENPEAVNNVSYSLVPADLPGPGNLRANPSFADPENGDFRLAPCSPAIDAASAVGPDIDISGHDRPMDFPGAGREETQDEFDMGALEAVAGELPVCTLIPTPTRTPIPGDLNLNGLLDPMDLFLFQEQWLRTPLPGPITPTPTRTPEPLPSPTPSETCFVVDIPDPILEKDLRLALLKATGDLTNCDLENLTQFTLGLTPSSPGYFSDVSSLEGLQYCSNLTRLSYSGPGSVTDISPLSGCVNLEFLEIQLNSIEDLTPLGSLVELEQLVLAFNKISDISPLQNLPNLTLILMQDNEISDLSPLAELPSLTHVRFDYNLISDLTPLATVDSLTYLGVEHNNVSDLTPLEPLARLSSLLLSYNSISDLQPLVDNPGIGQGDSIHLYGNPLSATAKCVQIPELRDRSVRFLIFLDDECASPTPTPTGNRR